MGSIAVEILGLRRSTVGPAARREPAARRAPAPSRPLRRISPILAVLALVAGCQATATPDRQASSGPASVAPSGPPVLGIDWGRAASLDRPKNFLESVPPDYISNHPILRVAGQAIMSDVASGPGGELIAVGYAPPDWLPIAWSSADGRNWSIHAIGTAVDTFPLAVTVGPDGTAVAVGRSGRLPLAWTSRDGATWDQHPVPVVADTGIAERITCVVATEKGYVAGGSMGPELGERHARFWRSADGRAWLPVQDDVAAFADTEVRAIASFDGGLVAVGVVGSAQKTVGAVAWTSADGGTSWSRVDDPSFAGAIAAAVVLAPGGGLVAVGSTVDRGAAVAWHSADGRTWTRAPGGRDLEEPGFVWMTDAVAIGGLVIAVGAYQPDQRGTAVSWISRDGATWERSTPAPVQEQAEFRAIAVGGPGAVAVGDYGLPDSSVPTVWLTPSR